MSDTLDHLVSLDMWRTVTTVHIGYSGSLQYMQSGSNKYILISYRVYPLYALSKQWEYNAYISSLATLRC